MGSRVSTEDEAGGDTIVGPAGGPRPIFYANGLQVATSDVDICLTFFIDRPGQGAVSSLDIYCSPEYAARVHAMLGRALEGFEDRRRSRDKPTVTADDDEG
jgi:hypothetical protein